MQWSYYGSIRCVDKSPALDMNLLRLFDAVYRLGSVSLAAEALGLSQPAASQGLNRLRRSLGDVLFVRSGGRMRPTWRAERMAVVVQPAIASLEGALREKDTFDPVRSRMTLRLHMSDIGEARLLPRLLAALHKEAPGMRVHSAPLPSDEIADALESGTIDFALGFLPQVAQTGKIELLHDRYAVIARAGHPSLAGRAVPLALRELRQLDYVAVRSHAETLRILQHLGLGDRVMVTTAHFLSLPAIIRMTDLVVVMPQDIVAEFADAGHFVRLAVVLPRSAFTVSLHWSRRFEADPAHQWIRALFVRLFKGR